MTADNNANTPRDVQFFDNYVPALEADDYTISATQSVNSSDPSHPLAQTFSVTQTFSIVAPRFALPPADVQSVYPPQNATGVFDQNFPHIVCRSRSLPWERLIDESDPTTKGTPWVALLLFTEDEIVAPAGAQQQALTNPTLSASYPVTSTSTAPDSLLTPANPAILGPSVTPEATDETSCKAIDITTAVFEQLTPQFAELPFLAHVRRVSDGLSYKATEQASGDGWFSVVIGNRFASEPNTTDGVRNIAHLVSLEGFREYLCDNPAWPAGITTVRLASLASWSFTCLPEVGDFAALARNLVASPVASVQLTNGGSGYTDTPVVIIEGGGTGGGAQAAATVSDGVVGALTVTDGGSGYVDPPLVALTGGGGFGATAVAVLSGDAVTSLSIIGAGAGYTAAPDVTFSGDSGSGASATAAIIPAGAISSIAMISAGAGYTSTPTVTITGGGGGAGATATATLAAAGGNALRLQLPVPGAAPPSPGSAAAQAQAALQAGYVPLAYDTRAGDQTFGFYHGPFTPAPIEPFSQAQPFESSAAATIYDKTTGTFDLTYAAAWETGRLLALSAGSHHATQLRLNRSLRRSVNLFRERTRLKQASSTAPKAVSHGFFAWMGTDLASRLPKPGRPAQPAAVRHHPEPARIEMQTAASQDLHAMFSQPDVQAHIANHLAEQLREPQVADAIDFQAGLRLLNGVPFNALIPHALMLPPESVRFFYVDPNYLDALSDGASSIGLQTTRDRAHQRLLRLPLRQAAIQRAATFRSRRIGQVKSQPTPAANDPVAGLLLRSALVSGWPGLEVKGYASDPSRGDVDPMPLLRMDRLAPDVLLCLFPQIPVWVELDEPKEGLAFGVEDNAQVALRYLDTTGGHMGQTTGTDVTFAATYYRDPATRVANIAAWQAFLASQVPASSTQWGPAAFAVQMVRAPEQMIFQAPPPPETNNP